MNECYDVSIVIPTENRSSLLTALLASLKSDRDSYSDGNTEVIVVDSSAGAEKEKIMQACEENNASYYAGDPSVRKKRNYGIGKAQYPYVLFIDSDVIAKPGLILSHMQTYRNFSGGRLGGVLGYTEFVGKVTFWWKLLEQTTLIDSFSFARKYPFQSWTIGNNVSFRKDALTEIGMFEENFPFKLGGDDLDMTYRLTKAGYLIKSCPEAVTYHSRETWSSMKAIHNRAKRWGTMEYYICQRHPEIYQSVIPRSSLINGCALLIGGIAAVLGLLWPSAIVVALSAVLFVLLNIIGVYILDMATANHVKNPMYYFFAKLVQLHYGMFRWISFLKHKVYNAPFRGMVFNRDQIRYGMIYESRRMWLALSCAALTIILARLLLLPLLTGGPVI